MFQLPQLPYEHNAHEPFIDARTMETHHGKHHATYVDNLNKALADLPNLQNKHVWELLSNLDAVPEDIRLKVRNNGGGHANHTFFWKLLSTEHDQTPTEEVMTLINTSFGDFESFKKQFAEAALNRFGSGWAWLVLINNEKLEITSTANQDTPWMDKKDAILGLDVWEHAYYLKYQNRRAEYVDAFWHITNWKQVHENLLRAHDYLKG